MEGGMSREKDKGEEMGVIGVAKLKARWRKAGRSDDEWRIFMEGVGEHVGDALSSKVSDLIGTWIGASKMGAQTVRMFNRYPLDDVLIEYEAKSIMAAAWAWHWHEFLVA